MYHSILVLSLLCRNVSIITLQILSMLKLIFSPNIISQAEKLSVSFNLSLTLVISLINVSINSIPTLNLNSFITRWTIIYKSRIVGILYALAVFNKLNNPNLELNMIVYKSMNLYITLIYYSYLYLSQIFIISTASEMLTLLIYCTCSFSFNSSSISAWVICTSVLVLSQNFSVH